MEAATRQTSKHPRNGLPVLLMALLCCAGVVFANASQRRGVEGAAADGELLYSTQTAGSAAHALRSHSQTRITANANKNASRASVLPVPTELELAGPRTVVMEVTAYCACSKCCGPKAQGLTASGRTVSYNAGRFVAADTAMLPFGTRVSIPGYHDGEAVEVIDRGSAIKGNRLDVYFPDHETAKVWGRRQINVQILN